VHITVRYEVGVMWFTAALMDGLHSLQKFKAECCYNEKIIIIILRDCSTYMFT